MNNLVSICLCFLVVILTCSELQLVRADKVLSLNHPGKSGGFGQGPSKGGGGNTNTKKKKKKTNSNMTMELNDGTVDGPWALVMGFAPLEGVEINPTAIVLRQLPKEIAGVRLVKCIIDLVYGQADALLDGLSEAYGKGAGAGAGGKSGTPNDPQLPPILFQQRTPPLLLIHIGDDPKLKKVDMVSCATNFVAEVDNRQYCPPTKRVTNAYPPKHVLKTSLPLGDIIQRVGNKHVQVSDNPGKFMGTYIYFKSLAFQSNGLQFLVCF